ncbi:MAG: hypothetical protein KIPDCIKN_00455 [Haliscomenobacter sp.]|nr:hypothetical protein [Haliscomenobacter sp.]
MPTSPLSPKLIKGALVELSTRFIGVVPNVIVFQYNPETMTRKLEPWSSGSEEGKSGAGPESATAQPHDPPETFDLAVEFDASDYLEFPERHPVAAVSGVADRISALELLLYPEIKSSGEELFGSAVAGLGGAALASGGAAFGGVGAMAFGSAGALVGGFIMDKKTDLWTAQVPRGTVPMVFLVWGPGRVVPVRLTSFSVEEQAYSPTLYPIRAKVTIGLKVLAPRYLPCRKKQESGLAVAAYNLYIRQKRGMAAGAVVSNAHSFKDMLPFL